jgi:hypothetical protein
MMVQFFYSSNFRIFSGKCHGCRWDRHPEVRFVCEVPELLKLKPSGVPTITSTKFYIRLFLLLWALDKWRMAADSPPFDSKPPIYTWPCINDISIHGYMLITNKVSITLYKQYESAIGKAILTHFPSLMHIEEMYYWLCILWIVDSPMLPKVHFYWWCGCSGASCRPCWNHGCC